MLYVRYHEQPSRGRDTKCHETPLLERVVWIVARGGQRIGKHGRRFIE